MMLIIILFLSFVQVTPIVLFHQPGAWTVVGHRHLPVLVSASEYFGNILKTQCPSIFHNYYNHPSLSLYCCVDSYLLTYFYTIAPND